MEKKALPQLKSYLPELEFKEAEGYIDEKLRIDVIFGKNGETLKGIQIKPVTFMKMRQR